MISTLKRAETGDALIIRLYEYAGRGETVELTLPEGLRRSSLVNLLERRPVPLTIANRTARIDIGPFKLLTLRLER